jgi:hypothetical protein
MIISEHAVQWDEQLCSRATLHDIAIPSGRAFPEHPFIKMMTPLTRLCRRDYLSKCEGRDLNPRTPSGTDLESVSVDQA